MLLVHPSLSSFAFVSALLSVKASESIVSFSGFLLINYSVYFDKWKFHLYGCWLPWWDLSKMGNMFPVPTESRPEQKSGDLSSDQTPSPLFGPCLFLGLMLTFRSRGCLVKLVGL